MGALRSGYKVTADLRLVRRLGGGGMASVWVAHHSRLDSEVIVKFLARSMAADDAARQRFAREVALSARVRSPHVVQMLDHGISEHGQPYLVMELLEGEDLDQLLRRRGKLDPPEVLHIVEGLSSALQLAHDRGIVHRDVKPSNVFLCKDGGGLPFVKLVDFGIAKRMEDAAVTQSGEMVGTPKYMSPEQFDAKTVDFRTDLWALGVLTYHALSGTPPFDGATFADVALEIMRFDVKPLSSLRRDLPPEIDRFMTTALAREPSHRFGSARELATSLGEALGRTSPRTGARIGLAALTDPTPLAPVPLLPDVVGATFRAAVTTPKPRNTGFSNAATVGLITVLITGIGGLGYRMSQKSSERATKKTKTTAAAPSPPVAAVPSAPVPPPPPLVDAGADNGSASANAKSDKPDAAADGKAEATASKTSADDSAKTKRVTAAPAGAARPKKPARPRPRSGDDDIGF